MPGLPAAIRGNKSKAFFLVGVRLAGIIMGIAAQHCLICPLLTIFLYPNINEVIVDGNLVYQRIMLCYILCGSGITT